MDSTCNSIFGYRLGADAIEAKAHSVAAEINIIISKEGMIEAAATVGRSCMSDRSESYAYWHGAVNELGEQCFGVAVYRNARALVRLDKKLVLKAYGPNAGELLSGLNVLGHRVVPKMFLDGVKFPSKIKSTYTCGYKTKILLPPKEVRVSYWGEGLNLISRSISPKKLKLSNWSPAMANIAKEGEPDNWVRLVRWHWEAPDEDHVIEKGWSFIDHPYNDVDGSTSVFEMAHTPSLPELFEDYML